MTKLASISLTATSDKARNIAQAFSYLEEAADAGADWLLLPEVFSYHGPYDQLYAQAEYENGPLNQRVANFARDHKVVVIAGTLAEKSWHDRLVYNTCYVFDRTGNHLAKYRKIHLFNLRDQDGKALYCESDGYLSGSTFETVTIDGFNCGLSICYDLRFPSFFQRLAHAAPLDVLILPAAFTRQTGEAHWELLLRARAVELQCYVFASNQVGTHSPGKESFGHGMVVDPWGLKLCDTGDKPGISYATISKARISEVRHKLPALANIRNDLY